MAAHAQRCSAARAEAFAVVVGDYERVEMATFDCEGVLHSEHVSRGLG